MKRALQLPQCPGCGTGWENTHVACRLLTWGDRDCHLGRPKLSPFSDRKEGRRPHRRGALEIRRGFSLNLQLRTNLHRLRVNLHKPGEKPPESKEPDNFQSSAAGVRTSGTAWGIAGNSQGATCHLGASLAVGQSALGPPKGSLTGSHERGRMACKSKCHETAKHWLKESTTGQWHKIHNGQ